jgi:3-methylcrotonyl-CoA carboxylase beta subunit
MPAMSDVVIIVKNQGRIFLAGPPLVKAATGEIVDDETLGGGEMHTSVSGVADYLATSDAHAIRLAREAVLDLGNITPKALPAVSPLTHSSHMSPPAVEPAELQAPSGRESRPPVYPVLDLEAIIPADPRQTYDMRDVIARVVDGSEFREFKPEYGKTIITGFAEIHGHT